MIQSFLRNEPLYKMIDDWSREDTDGLAREIASLQSQFFDSEKRFKSIGSIYSSKTCPSEDATYYIGYAQQMHFSGRDYWRYERPEAPFRSSLEWLQAMRTTSLSYETAYLAQTLENGGDTQESRMSSKILEDLENLLPVAFSDNENDDETTIV